jgi:hypothetical protein
MDRPINGAGHYKVSQVVLLEVPQNLRESIESIALLGTGDDVRSQVYHIVRVVLTDRGHHLTNLFVEALEVLCEMDEAEALVLGSLGEEIVVVEPIVGEVDG